MVEPDEAGGHGVVIETWTKWVKELENASVE